MARKTSRLITLALALCLFFSLMGVSVWAEDTIIEKVYATSNKEAVVMRTAGEISFTTSTQGAAVVESTWTDPSGKALSAGDAFANETYTLVVKLSAKEGYVFGAAASGYLYGKSCDIAVSADGKSVSLRTQVRPPVWSPIIVK